MTRTARLSRRFYETFGDENTNELVGLLNEMDETYLNELRTLNAANFALFDAKVEQRFAESDARTAKRFAALEPKFARIDARFSEFGALLERRLNEQGTRQIRWLVGLWALTVAGLATFVIELQRLRP